MQKAVFIDGHAGTIGLRIRELLAHRREFRLLEIEQERRKDLQARRRLLNACDVAILCLPDEASLEAVALIENPAVRVIDGSTAFRVHSDWVYGLPELLPQQREKIRAAKRVSNPGCWPTGVALLTRPLIDSGLLPPDIVLSIHGVSGYSGGGKAMIERWESEHTLKDLPFEAPYALDRRHKHLPEMQRYGRLSTEPVFRPAVGAFERGMRVEISLHASSLGGVTAEQIRRAYLRRYEGEPFVQVMAEQHEDLLAELRFDPRACNGKNLVNLSIVAHPSGHVRLIAILDNLGKGASGAAVQSLNLMLGLPEQAGL